MLALNGQVGEKNVESNLTLAPVKLDSLELLPAVSNMPAFPSSAEIVSRLFHLDSNVLLSPDNQQVDSDIVTREEYLNIS